MTLKKVNLITTSIFTVLYLIGTVATGIMAPFSVMAFDAPGSDKMIEPWIFIITAFTWPIMFLLAIILSWLLYALMIYQGSLIMLILPFINLFIFILLFSGFFGPMSVAP